MAKQKSLSSSGGGAFLFFSGVIMVLGIALAEIMYPGYNVFKDYISTLGSSPPPNSIVIEPSASIFDITLILAGLSTILGVILISKSIVKDRAILITMLLMGIGTTGVGFFPAYTGMLHSFFALLAFLFGGVAAIMSVRITQKPFGYFAVALGITALVFLAGGLLAKDIFLPIFGIGGTERLVAYPEILWLIGFGSYLMGRSYSK